MGLSNASLLAHTAEQLQRQLSAGSITSAELVDACLKQIETHDAYLHAVISKAPRELARTLAQKLDTERAAGLLRGPMHGIPVLIKDNIATDPSLGMDTTAGSLALAGSKPRRNAPVAQSLLDAGMIIIGKANMSEFAWYKTAKAPAGWSPAGGQTQSAYVRGGFQEGIDTSAGHSSPGGSSSGSAVGLSAGYAPVSIGTETQGSLTLPANRAALFALKPTVGVIPASGIVPICHLCDSPGPMAKTAKDIADLMDIMIGSSRDEAAEGAPRVQYAEAVDKGWKGLRIGSVAPANWTFSANTRRPVKEADAQLTEQVLGAYELMKRRADAYCGDIELISADRFVVDGKGLLSSIFAATFQEELEQYLGSLAESRVRTLEDVIQFNKDHAEVELPPGCPGQEFLEDAVGRAISAAELRRLSHLLRRLGRDEGLDKAFAKYDVNVIVGPAESSMTLLAAAAGYPIASLPVGYLDYNGRPHGLAAIACAHDEARLIQLMGAWESVLPTRQLPSLLLEDD